MMVTFVSQCEKKALAKTRRVLDSFANRIGDRTWQTVMTAEGLLAVRKLLRKTASKSTAVSCHQLKSRSRTELLWIIGNRRKFNAQGIVPVNRTGRDILHRSWEDDWHALPLIKSLAALAGLFHDWGKASELFQAKLDPACDDTPKGDPLRHEWISALFLSALVSGGTDEQWLERLAQGQMDRQSLMNAVRAKNKKPLSDLPSAAGLIGWLVLTHHRLPLDLEHVDDQLDCCVETPADILKKIAQKWGYENRYEEAEFKRHVSRCFDYPHGLPDASKIWMKEMRRYAGKMLALLPQLNSALEDGSWRLVLHHARLSLMLGDHFYSSLDFSDARRVKGGELELWANTAMLDGEKKRKQKLDEHLVGVAKQAARNAHMLPLFEANEDELQSARDKKVLQRKSPAPFEWQDRIVGKIRTWREQQGKALNVQQFGFFAVNMASTGKGKTFANAKIMRALSADSKSLRYILALGLRTLTLQTGDEYRQRIGLDRDELAVLIGSRAVLDLHEKDRQEHGGENEELETGSQSSKSLLDNELFYETDIPQADLKTVLQREKHRKFLYAPVLSCTIDHLMAATETKRGGRYILPCLRLMSSDLVIDEIDDFDGEDLVAIARLVHLAGMLGRKVMISSATIPPDLAEGYFNAYQAGWALFARMRERSPVVGCAFVDEFASRVESVTASGEGQGAVQNFARCHEKFVKKRLANLQKQKAVRKAEIVSCGEVDKAGATESREAYFLAIRCAIEKKHKQHSKTDEVSGKQVSFGVVRMANIKPCVELTRYLLGAQWSAGIEVRAMAYHSGQILIMRNAQERHLDEVLTRKQGSQAAFDHPLIRQHLQSTKAPHVIFILVATPVEEVGRDHDFDWAVIEPSSMRSIIQLAGRVMRHRELKEGLAQSNIALMQYNLKGLQKGDSAVFRWPGYESKRHFLNSHDLRDLLDEKALAQRLDAAPRIARPQKAAPQSRLADLEHAVLADLLTSYEEQGPECLQGWLAGCWWMTALPQHHVRFRRGVTQELLYLLPDTHRGWKFAQKHKEGGYGFVERMVDIERGELTKGERAHLWLERDYKGLLQDMADAADISLERAALIYGEITLQTYGRDKRELSFVYNDQLGMTKA